MGIGRGQLQLLVSHSPISVFGSSIRRTTDPDPIERRQRIHLNEEDAPFFGKGSHNLNERARICSVVPIRNDVQA